MTGRNGGLPSADQQKSVRRMAHVAAQDPNTGQTLMTKTIEPPVDITRELTMTREFRARRDLVFSMFSDPEKLNRWWGPKGFSITTDHMDFRPGGHWKFTMHGPNGVDYPNFIRYVEIATDRLVFEHSPDGGETSDFQLIASLEEIEPKKTRLQWRMIFKTAALCQNAIDKFGAARGLADTLTRLDRMLADTQAEGNPFRLNISLPSDTEIRMTRSFRAPQALVFEAMTNAEHLCQWQSPYKYHFTECSFDGRVGF